MLWKRFAACISAFAVIAAGLLMADGRKDVDTAADSSQSTWRKAKPRADVAKLLKTYCFDCHAGKPREPELDLQATLKP